MSDLDDEELEATRRLNGLTKKVNMENIINKIEQGSEEEKDE